MEKVLNKSDLITRLSSECENIPEKTIEDATKQIIDLMVDTLSQNGRVEVRGFIGGTVEGTHVAISLATAGVPCAIGELYSGVAVLFTQLAHTRVPIVVKTVDGTYDATVDVAVASSPVRHLWERSSWLC